MGTDDDARTPGDVLLVLTDDVAPLLTQLSGDLYAAKDASGDEAQREALHTAADWLAQAWAQTRIAMQVLAEDVTT